MLNDWKMGKAASADQVRQLLAMQKEVRAVKETAGGKSEPPVLAERDYAAALADTATPMSNAAIEEWNRRRRRAD